VKNKTKKTMEEKLLLPDLHGKKRKGKKEGVKN